MIYRRFLSYLRRPKSQPKIEQPIYWNKEIPTQHISANAIKVLNALQKAGFTAYLVGGGVRDLLAGKIPKDFDVATDAAPEQIMTDF